jgi:hypothetical protein
MPKPLINWDKLNDQGRVLETLAKPPSPPPQTPSKLQRNELRFELVKAALTGLLANPNINAHTDYLSTMAIRQADATLAEWEKNQI